jgi:hypothetical protein
MTRPHAAVTVVVVAAWLAGCAGPADRPDANVIQPAPASLPQPRLSPLPVKVGVFYAPEFAQQPVADRARAGISHRAGAASIALFDRVLEAAFEQVLRLPAWPLPAGAEHPAVAAVFVPRIAGIATVHTPGSTARLLEYAIEAYSPSGERIDSWTIHAKSRREGPWSARDDQLYPAALRDAAAQLLTSVPARPALKRRLPAAAPASAGTRPGGTPVGSVRVAITSPLEAAEARERAGETRCVAEALAQANPGATVIPLEEIQDELFPWLEHANLADTAQRMLELMRLAPVREGLGAARLDYIAFLHTERTSERNPETIRCDTSYRAYGCSGVRGDALKSRVQVSLWNLKRYSMSARFETESAGSATFSGVVVPIPGQQSSPASACARAGDAIGRLVGGG